MSEIKAELDDIYGPDKEEEEKDEEDNQ